MMADQFAKARAYLRNADPVLAALASEYGAQNPASPP